MTPMQLTWPDVRRAWKTFFSYDDYERTPLWLRVAVTVVFCMFIALVFTAIGFILYAGGEGAWRNWRGWIYWYGQNLIVSLSVGFTIFGLYAALYATLGRQRIQAMSWGRKRLVFSAVPLVGMAIGWPLGLALIGQSFLTWFDGGDGNSITRTLLLVVLISFVFNVIGNARAKQIEAERAATEAQLRLLQAQIEPHFLFNTLANVQSLMEHDLPKARQMLSSFTDYLRASLGTLRQGDSTLSHELDLAQAYLSLLKTRMEDRLQFHIHNDPALRGAKLPPLLLQPLVENAVVHGLEPSVEGGSVQVTARAVGRNLVLEVSDTGRGLDAPKRLGARAGSGVALDNIRQRLSARYGGDATLELAAGNPGTRARITLPLLA